MICAGTSLGLWIVGRLLQGASTGTIWSAGIALIVDSVEQSQLGKYLGTTGTALSIGTLMGPVLGGVIYERRGYYAVFAFSFAFIAVDLELRLIVIEKRQAGSPTESSLWPSQPRSPGKEITREESRGTAHTCQVQGHEAASHSLAQSCQPAAFVLLSAPRMLSALYGCTILSLMVGSFETVLPLFVHDMFGWEQTGQGLIFMAINIPQLLSPLAGTLMDRYPRGCRYVVSGAFVAGVPVFICLRFVTHNSMSQKVLLCALLALFGLCVALGFTGLLREIGLAAEENEAKERKPYNSSPGGNIAQAFGLSTMAYGIGSLIGPFLAGYIRDSQGMGTVAWVLGLLSGVTAIPTLLLTEGWIGRRGSGF
ncbi:hypothetical protein AnigIFM56816_001281 [Aspergillus niger]|nr:hypothetical protein AnigIFM56816_001281 [Aspergillus niger]